MQRTEALRRPGVPRAVTVLGVVVALAAALLVVGALLPGRDGSTDRTAPAVDLSLAATLAPAVGAGDLDARISALQERVRMVPDDWTSSANLGLAYLQKERITADPTWYEKAAVVLAASLETNPDDNLQGKLGMALLESARHDFESSLTWSRIAIEASPTTSYTYAAAGDALVGLGRYAEADRFYQKMIDLRPDLASYSRVSYARELRGDVSGAIAAMKSAQSATSVSGEDAAWVGYQLGELYLGVGRISLAFDTFQRASAASPDYYLPLVGLAQVAFARGNLDGAIQHMEKVVEQLPLPQYVGWLGDLYEVDGRSAQAARQFALVEAEHEQFAASDVLPDVDVTLYLADHGDATAALELAREQYAERPSIQVTDALAWALHANGRDAAALRYAREALRLGTKDALILFHAGMIARAAGSERLGIRYISRAADLNPAFSFLHARTATEVLSRT
jgi:tetratricopeptide (TPR) repeat protein